MFERCGLVKCPNGTVMLVSFCCSSAQMGPSCCSSAQMGLSCWSAFAAQVPEWDRHVGQVPTQRFVGGVPGGSMSRGGPGDSTRGRISASGRGSWRAGEGGKFCHKIATARKNSQTGVKITRSSTISNREPAFLRLSCDAFASSF